VLGILREPARIVDLLADLARSKPGSKGGLGFVR